MQAKSRKIGRTLDIPSNFYFDAKDKKAIEKWTDEICKKIWEKIKGYSYSSVLFGLGTHECVFCIYLNIKRAASLNPYCPDCEWGQRHGFCMYGVHIRKDEFMSDYQFICYLFIEDEKDIENVLSIEFYKELVNKLEKEV
jgi:hypothetical protein